MALKKGGKKELKVGEEPDIRNSGNFLPEVASVPHFNTKEQI